MSDVKKLALAYLFLAVAVWWLCFGTGLQLSWWQAAALFVVVRLSRYISVRADRLRRPAAEPLPGVGPDAILVAMDPRGHANIRAVAGPCEVTAWDATTYQNRETHLRVTLRPKVD